ncbi:unnamed protein product [Caenorhabditis bovis]|uniref:Uncharacterized protein n=1 Tax=Caenorhabditis bovis TaxID=2654633 RepID=A0A8S1EJF2_9PELO|nr:unnamed protein product [Caenorhabditis bovis]
MTLALHKVLIAVLTCLIPIRNSVHIDKQLNSFQEIVWQKTRGNHIPQCPCVIHPESRQCISYDSRYVASSYEEAILSFVELSNPHYHVPIINSNTFSCVTSECQQCFSLLYHKLLDIGFLPQNYRSSIMPLPRNRVNPNACPRFRFQHGRLAPSPPANVPSYLTPLISAGRQFHSEISRNRNRNENHAPAISPFSFNFANRINNNNHDNNNNNFRNNVLNQQRIQFRNNVAIQNRILAQQRQNFINQPPNFQQQQNWPQMPQPRPLQNFIPPQPQWNGLFSNLFSSLGHSLIHPFADTGGGGGGTLPRLPNHPWLRQLGIGLKARHKRQASTVIGKRFEISCNERGDSEDDMMSLCGSCWTWRQLPENYFPRIINELSCRKDDFCLSGWGECVQQFRNVDVLRRENGRWIPTITAINMAVEEVQQKLKKMDVNGKVIRKVAGNFNVVLGIVTPHNVLQLKKLNEAVFPITYNDKFYVEVRSAGELAKLAYFNDVVVGAVCCRVDIVNGEKSLYIMTLGTLAPYRQFGIGTVLINHVFHLCVMDDQIKTVCLHVQINNDTALNFYKRNGFDIVEMVDNYYRIEPSGAYLLIPRSSEFLEDIHQISKRSVNMFNSIPVSRGCNLPGYTGETCQYPLCAQKNPYVPDDQIESSVAIDAANLANCSETMVILVDETMWDITINLESESPLNPNFYLQYEDGSIITPSSDRATPTEYSAKYDFLQPGQYILGPIADLPDEFCSMLMSARTKMHVTGGFTSGDYNERNDFPQKYAYFDTKSSVILRPQGMTYPAEIQAIGFTGTLNHISRFVEISHRYNCTYPYLHERYVCDKNADTDVGHMFMQVEGVSENGYKFRRIVPFSCIVPPAVTTTTSAPKPTPGPITYCANGGQLLNDTNNQPYCYCFGYFTGDDCTQMVCANGGYLPTPTSKRCECPDGFSGFHCENIICTEHSGRDFDAEHPTLTLVIRSRTQLSEVIKSAVDGIQEAIDSLSFDPNYLASFIVVLFDNNQILLNKRYTSWNDAVTDLNKAINSAPSDGGCEDAVFSAISSALSLYPNNKSPLYIITDANPNDSNEKETVFHLESYWRAPLYFVYVQPAPGDGCNSSPDSSGYRDYIDIAGRTSGNTFYFSDRRNIKNFMFNHITSTIYRSQLAISGDYTHCGQQNLYKTVSFDADTDMIVVVATGSNLKLLVTDPFVNRPEFYVVYQDGQNFIWTKRGAVSGQWFFTILSDHDSDACTFKVYRKRFNSLPSSTYSPDYDIFWGFSTDLVNDGALRQPIFGLDSSPVFHVTDYPQFLSMDRVHAALEIYAIREGRQVEVYGSNGIWRDACSLQFYFPPFTCRVPEETLYFNFYARDRFDMSIQRAGTMYCSYIHPTPIPDHQCQNGGVMNPSNTTCFCPPEFTGTYCQNIVCFNGATNNGDHCVCPPGFAGENCELARCTEEGPAPEFLRTGVDMIFAVEITANSLGSLVYLNNNFQEILRDVVMQNNQWIRNFVLVGFNSTWGGPIAESPANNLSAIIDAMNTLAKSVPTDNTCGNVQLWDALNHAIFSREVAPGSYIEIFQTTPEDDTDARSLGIFYDMTRRMEVILYGFLTLSPRNQPNGYACNATIENFYTLLGLVSGSNGITYSLQAAEIENAVRLIPLQYSNGLVNFNYEQDCRFEPMITYFPIDAYSQTIQLNAYGFGSVLEVYDGAGNKQEVLQLFADDFTGESVYEIRKACDEDWEPLGQYCVKFISDTDSILPMPEAKKFCANAGGFLVDDLTQDKNDFLYQASSKTQFWIGLYETNGAYVWDRGNNANPDPLNQQNNFWEDVPHQPGTTDQCVYFDGQSSDKNRVWKDDTCSTPRPFVCQKHRYDADHRPNTIGDDDLPAGNWYATLKTSPQGDNPRFCSLGIRVQSNLQIVTGYVTNIGSDFPEIDPIQDSKDNRLITYIHSLDNENRSPILTDAVLWDAYNGTFYNGLKYGPRFACQYGWVSQDFACPNGLSDNNEFGVVHIGEDEFGNTFQRITYGHCSKAEIVCGNGGVRQDGKCICNDYWTGSRCTVPICVNGGTRNDNEATCNCPDGYTGFNCQYEVCQPKIPATFSNDGKTLIIILEATQQNQDTINQLNSNLNAVLKSSVSANPNWFSKFGLVVFNSNGRTFENYNYDSIDALTNAIASNTVSITDAGSCSLPYYDVIAHIGHHAENLTIPNSEFLLFTAASASDVQNYVELVDELFNLQAHLHLIYSKTANCPDYTGISGLYGLTWLGYGSGGNILFTDPTSIIDLVGKYLPTLYGSSVLQDPTGISNFSCSSGDPWFVPVTMNTSTIYITTTSEYGSLSAIDPLGRKIAPNVIYNVNDQKMYSIDVNRIGGIWNLQLTSPPGVCLAHIYTSGDGPKVYTKFALTNPVGKIQDPTGAHQDGGIDRPVPGFENVATFHLNGHPGHQGVLQYVEIFDATNVTNLIRSELYRRADCSYEYYSDPFICDTDVLAIYIHGLDEARQKFRRQEVVVCNGPKPVPPVTTLNPVTQSTLPVTNSPKPTTLSPITENTPNPPNTPTSNPNTVQTGVPVSTTTTPAPSTTRGYTNTPFDIVFLIDGSKSASDSFNQFTKFIQTMMVTFTVSQNNARVGLIVVDPNSHIPPVAQLNSIGSQDSLNGYLSTMQYYADFSQDGQLLNFYLQVASSAEYTSPDAGYRSTINNHVIVYITATTEFDTDPTNTAKSIIQNKQYGIITVGYGSGVSNDKLIAISGGNACSFTANDFATLNNQIKPIQSLIMSADSNGGVYCSSN